MRRTKFLQDTLLPAAVEATRFVRGLTIARCVARRYVSFNLSRRFKEDIATLVEHCNRTFVNASVFLVSCGGLLVKKKNTNSLRLFILRFIVLKKSWPILSLLDGLFPLLPVPL